MTRSLNCRSLFVGRAPGASRRRGNGAPTAAGAPGVAAAQGRGVRPGRRDAGGHDVPASGGCPVPNDF